MKNKLTRNIGLKLASVFLAVILWLVVNSINNPTLSENYYNIPITLLNTDLITDSGRVYKVLEGTDTLNRVTIRAPRSVLNEIKSENIVATADVNELSSLDTISVKLSTNIHSRDIISIVGSSDTVKLNIENTRSKTLALKATVSGEVESGYILGDVITAQNLVRISGPESVIEKVTRAGVDIDVTGFTSDIGTNIEIRLYDADGNVVNDPDITQNIKTVGVTVSIWQTSEIPVHFNVTGEPSYGYQFTGEIEGNNETVRLAGKAATLRTIQTVEIPDEVLDITDLEEDLTTQIDIRQYLPEGVFLADASQAMRTVTVHLEREGSKRLELRGERVQITNVPEGYTASISELGESFIIDVLGLSRDIAAIQAADIRGTVDVAAWMNREGMTEPRSGFYTVEVDFGFPGNVRLRTPVTVILHLSEKEE